MGSCQCTNIYYICIIICLLPQGPALVPPPTMGALPPHTGSSYRVQRGLAIPPPGNTPVCSSEEEQEDKSTVEDQGEEDRHVKVNQCKKCLTLTPTKSHQTSDWD